jgi:predicted nucleic acid-binding protein
MEMSISSSIPDGASVLIDTNPIIYVLEGHPLAADFEPLFAEIDSGRIHGVVTPVTLAEVVSGPLKAGKEALAERYRRVLTKSAGFTLREIDAEIAVLAARLRNRYRLRLPDAFQLATAIQEGCHALVTHDRDFAGVNEMLILRSAK